MKYRSKIGAEIVLSVAFILILVFVTMIKSNCWTGLFIVIASVGFVVYMASSTYYIIRDKELIIRSGFIINLTICIDTITVIKETNNPLGSPALSLNRILIRYNNNDSVMISPVKKDEFIDALLHINDKIEVVLKKNKQK